MTLKKSKWNQTEIQLQHAIMGSRAVHRQFKFEWIDASPDPFDINSFVVKTREKSLIIHYHLIISLPRLPPHGTTVIIAIGSEFPSTNIKGKKLVETSPYPYL